MNYDDAVQYAINRRSGEPAIYNHNRLRERPIPELHGEQEGNVSEHGDEEASEEDHVGQEPTNPDKGEYDGPNQHDDDCNGSNQGEPDRVVPNQIEADSVVPNSIGIVVPNSVETDCVEPNPIEADGVVPDLCVTAGAQSHGTEENQHDDEISAQLTISDDEIDADNAAQNAAEIAAVNAAEIKDEVLVIQPNPERMNVIENLIDEPEFSTVEHNGMLITINNRIGFGKPFSTNHDGLVKRENDPVSGDLAFNETV